jgi:hypothetical protein
MENESVGRFAKAPLVLTGDEMSHLQYLKRHPAGASLMPCSMRVRFIAHACIIIHQDSLALAPRGQKALVLGRL